MAVVRTQGLFFQGLFSLAVTRFQCHAIVLSIVSYVFFPCHSFNIVTYASTVAKWQEELVPVAGDGCAQAVQWLRTLRAGGASCLLEALKVCLHTV